MVKYLLDQRANVNAKNYVRLYSVCLLDGSLIVSGCSTVTLTPLHVACERGRLNMVLVLIDRGAGPQATTKVS